MTVRDLAALGNLDPDEVQRAITILRKESDRGAILVAISLLDGIMTTRLRDLLDRGNREAADRLLKPPMGSISSFSAKVDLAFCIGLMPKAIYDDIRRLKKLRNLCAHGWDEFQVTPEVVEQHVEPMMVMRALRAANSVRPGLWVDPLPPRNLLLGALAALVTLTNLHKPAEPIKDGVHAP